MVPYIVRQGDYLLRLAHLAGVSPSEIWDHPKNRRLREQRGDGSMLAPLDVIYLPARRRRFHSATVGGTTRFVAAPPVVKIEAILEDEQGPIANEPFVVLELPTANDPQKTGPDGLLTIHAPITRDSVTVELTARGSRFPLLIGHLDPATEHSGIEHRLANLGYRTSTNTLAALGADPNDLAAPLRQFQRDAGLPVTGVCDDATRKALIARHGC